MKSQDILDAIGMVDEECVQNAKPKRKSYKGFFVTVASFAASFGLIFLVTSVLNFDRNHLGESEEYYAQSCVAVSSSGAYQPSVAEVTMDNVKFYYVDGDKISSVEQLSLLKPESVFWTWKAKNGIGEEVELIEYRSESSGGYSTTFEFQGKEYIKYTLPDYFVLYITVSANIENYYDKVDSELLLESLKQTMSTYMIEYDECHISFE